MNFSADRREHISPRGLRSSIIWQLCENVEILEKIGNQEKQQQHRAYRLLGPRRGECSRSKINTMKNSQDHENNKKDSPLLALIVWNVSNFVPKFLGHNDNASAYINVKYLDVLWGFCTQFQGRFFFVVLNSVFVLQMWWPSQTIQNREKVHPSIGKWWFAQLSP